MSDTSERSGPEEATPNRARRREPPIIDGEATSAETPPAPKRQHGAALAVALVLVAIAMAGAGVFVGLNGRGTSTNEVAAALAQRLDRLERRISALESKPAPTIPDIAPIAMRLSAIDIKSDKAINDATRATQAADEALRRPMPQAQTLDLAPLEKRLEALEARAASAPTTDDARLAKLESDLAALRGAAQAHKSDASALAIVAESLRQKIERGVPFMPEITALEKLGADGQMLAAVKPLAVTGAPTAQKLAQDFSPLSSAMLKVANPAPDNEDLLDRLSRSATSLVRIRPIGDSAEENAPALLARIEAALQRNDIEVAVTLFEGLPQAAKNVGQDWAKRAKARANADAAARALIQTGLDRIAGK